MKRLIAGGCLFLAVSLVLAQPPAGGAKAIDYVYGQALRVRPGGAKDWKDAPRVGVDVYHDAANGSLLAMTEAGNLAVAPFATPGEKKIADWLNGFDLRVRKSTDEKFTNARRVGVEVFLDQGAKQLLYVSETKAAAFAPIPAMPGSDKEATFHHGLVLSVREAKQVEWANAKKFGVEAFKDGNTGGLLYLAETGAIATAAAPEMASESPKPPKWIHAMVLRVRKADEDDFTPQTRNLAVEVYQDPNSGALVFVSDAGSIAAARAPEKLEPTGAPAWKGAFKIPARKGTDTDFKAATKFGVEVFEDARTQCLIYATETGAIAVRPKQ